MTAACGDDDSAVLPRAATTTIARVDKSPGRAQALLCVTGQVAVRNSDGTHFCADPPATTMTVPGPDGHYNYDGPCPPGQVPSPVLAPPNCVETKTAT
jgi:hypothetical protein